MVKYADGPTTEAEITIDAPPAVVWPLLIDINTPAAFSQEFQGADWLDPAQDGRPTLGARFRGRNKHRVVGEWQVTCTVSAIETEQVFEWTVAGGDRTEKAARWRFDLSAAGADRSTLRFSAEMGPGPSGLTPAIERMPEREEDIVARRLDEWNANMVRTIEGIKSLAEGAAPPETADGSDHDDAGGDR
jgi:uncharacterized protein YndB with AHSA1/START domain